MTCDVLGPGALDYLPCRYGASKLLFRGPRRALDAPYVAFIGGTQTFGKFIEKPYPLRVEHLTGVTSVNLGQMNAGLDVFAKDKEVHRTAQGARVTVLEVLGAINMSSRLYTVHPRRNDRFVCAGPQLQRLYPDVDFTQFHFTRHMLRYLYRKDCARFMLLREELQRVWVRRMRRLISYLGDNVVLLGIGNAGESEDWATGGPSGPALVSDAMIGALDASVRSRVSIPLDAVAPQTQSQGKVFHPMEEEAAKTVVGTSVHNHVARALRPVLDRLM